MGARAQTPTGQQARTFGGRRARDLPRHPQQLLRRRNQMARRGLPPQEAYHLPTRQLNLYTFRNSLSKLSNYLSHPQKLFSLHTVNLGFKFLLHTIDYPCFKFGY